MSKDKDFKIPRNKANNDHLNVPLPQLSTAEFLDSTLHVSVDPRIPPDKLVAALEALADFYRKCGGIGFQVLSVKASDPNPIA
ncbi:MAG TPA: hypothetical protein VN658_08200 [Candidatus Acidoferrales bacterium]|nr:hypothetical protein [Candidatus Acidoferrales bacterium]